MNQNEKKQEILYRIDTLLQNDKNFKSSEIKILKEYRERIEKSKEIEFELVKFRNALLPLVISSEISQPILRFYKELRADRKITWGEGSSLLTGLSQFPS